MALERIPFGLATITVGEGEENPVVFDGATDFQADGGEVTLSPQLTDINVADFGPSVYDQRVNGYTGSLTIVALETKIKTFQAALAASSEITDATSGDVTGITDAPIGTSLRDKARKVRIHPRDMGTDDSLDIVIYKMASNGDFTRGFANEQGSLGINLAMFPRDGLDPTLPGNFFYIGSTDPNAAATTTT